jgi:hypothetical protein
MTLGLTVRLAMAGLAFGMGVAMGGCSAGCVSSDQKLARLTPGMSYGEVSAVMGCQGRLVRGSLDDADTYAIAEWPGPTSLLLHQTDMLFFDRRLFWYDSRSAPGF